MGTSSKESLYIFVESTKNPRKDESSITKGKVTGDKSPKPKEAEKRTQKRRPHIEDIPDVFGKPKADVRNGHWKQYKMNHDRRRKA